MPDSTFVLFILLQVTFWVLPSAEAFSLSRRELLVWPVGAGGAILYGKFVSDTLHKFLRGDAYPEAHEQMVESTILAAVAASIPPTGAKSSPPRPFRVLEVGIGRECRVARRGLYKSAIQEAASRGVTMMEVTGVDIAAPSGKILDEARDTLQKFGTEQDLHVDFRFIPTSITSKLDAPDGYFDCVLAVFTLCSVDDQMAALRELRRVIRQDGGSFGYVEHVAVNPNEPYRFLELQQNVFDPLQQAVAGNCHLHRYTENTISEAFDLHSNVSSTKIFGERRLVDGMWPISCQCSGVIQRHFDMTTDTSPGWSK